MKTIGCFLVIILVSSCAGRDGSLTDKEKENIIKEISVLTDQIVKGSEIVDYKMAHAPYADSEEFVHASNGKMTDFAGFGNGNLKYFETIESQKFVKKDEKYTVLSADVVVVNWVGQLISKRKDGTEGGLDDFSVTLVFRKKDGQWKIINSHESW